MFVFAKDLKLNDLAIENGELSPTFEPLNTSYTVVLDSEVERIAFLYEVDNDVEVSIESNEDLQNNSIVLLHIKNEKEQSTYTFQVLKEEEEITPTFKEETEETLTNSFMMQYKMIVIPIFCLIFIFISYKVVFYHKK